MTDCMFAKVDDKWKCSLCGYVHARKTSKPPTKNCSVQYSEPIPKRTGGPGTEATLLLASLGIMPVVGCPCRDFSVKMDRWGVAGCREHFAEIVKHFQDYQVEYGWSDKLKAASLSVLTGLVFKLNWFDPLPDFVNEAIRRAEEKENADYASSLVV